MKTDRLKTNHSLKAFHRSTGVLTTLSTRQYTHDQDPNSMATTHPVVLSDSDISARASETSPLGNVSWKTLFTSSRTPTDSLSTGIAVCPPRTGHLCAHRHEQAEVYYIIEGRGTVKIEGKESDVQAGSVVFIPGDAEHAIWNLGEEPLRWFYVFPVDDFWGDVVYRFS
jgi:mannose-6-phosphate isomerase-like protein (cupin superfamily)